jgi:hypothetical protein
LADNLFELCLSKFVLVWHYSGAASELPSGLALKALGGQPCSSAMRETELFPLKLRMMTDEELWSLFLENREQCSHEFWQEVENRKAAATLAQSSPFWHINAALVQRHARRWPANSNVIRPTPEEWEARKRRNMFRVISA